MSKKSTRSGHSSKDTIVDRDNDSRDSLSYQEIVQLTNNLNKSPNTEQQDKPDSDQQTNTGGALDGSVSMSDR